MRTYTLTLIFVVLLCHSSQSVAEVNQCDETATVLKLLEERYEETVTAFGVTNNGLLLQLLQTPAGHDKPTWSLIFTDAKGKSCLITAGEAWREALQILGDPT